MIAAVAAPAFAPAAAAKAVVGRKSLAGAAVAPRASLKAQRVNRSVVASVQKEKLAAAVVVAAGAIMANPLAAEAAIPPSVKNLLLSVTAGTVVVGGIVAGITFVSNFDRIDRR